jgi:S-DNA-T family DNA segregation ATPase FtsK/SpoIIIE
MVRRQELLRAAGNYVSRHEYELARQSGEPLAPLPSLLIICDEFSELLAEKPDFIDLFVMLGRLGRSLGVHLLLASQRLEEGRLRGLDTHLSYRIGLRTFSAMESRVVLGVPDAYELPTAPGHGYLQAGTQTMQRFRAAYVSGPYRARAEARRASPAVVARRVVPYGVAYVPVPAAPIEPEPLVELPRRPRDARPPCSTSSSSGCVATAPRPTRCGCRRWTRRRRWTRCWGRSSPIPSAAWSPPAGGRLTVPVGIEDRPFEQRRDPLLVQLDGAAGNVAVVGGPRAARARCCAP